MALGAPITVIGKCRTTPYRNPKKAQSKTERFCPGGICRRLQRGSRRARIGRSGKRLRDSRFASHVTSPRRVASGSGVGETGIIRTSSDSRVKDTRKRCCSSDNGSAAIDTQERTTPRARLLLVSLFLAHSISKPTTLSRLFFLADVNLKRRRRVLAGA